jgi:type III secretion protein W
LSEERVQGVNPTGNTAQNIRQQQQAQLNAQMLAQEVYQEASAEGFEELCDYAAFNPVAANKFAQELSKRLRPPEKEKPQGAKNEEVDHQIVEEISQIAEEFSRKNPEFNTRALIALSLIVTSEDSVETILEKLFASYPDAYLVDEAIEFLLRITQQSNSLFAKLLQAKTLLQQNFEREILIGRNISQEAREFSEKGLGNASGLRDLYKWVTGTEQEPLKVFEDLIKKFPYDQMKSVLAFLLHSLGSDIKSKGPSMDPLELQKLFAETRTVQAILGVYLYFMGRMNFLERQFGRYGEPKPEEINFEKLAKIFVQLLAEKYPSVGRVLQMANQLGISSSIIAQAIVFSNYRDSLRYVSPRLFKNEKQRQDLMQALVECVSELDEKIEESEDEEEEE